MAAGGHWGAVVEHDGSGLPAGLRGRRVRAQFEFEPGRLEWFEGVAGAGGGLSWDWRNWGRVMPDGGVCARVTRYAVWRPRGLAMLDAVLAETAREAEAVG